MDNQNTYKLFKYVWCRNVLILVLMDNQNTSLTMTENLFVICLNPCSNG